MAVVCYPSFGLAIVCSFIDLWLQGMYGGFSLYLRNLRIDMGFYLGFWINAVRVCTFFGDYYYGRRFCFVLAGSLYFCVPKYALWTVMAYEVLFC